MNEYLPIVFLSLKISLLATLLAGLSGIPFSLFLALKNFRGKRMLLTFIHSLMAVPTVVIGLFIYSLIRRGALFGSLDLLFTPTAIVIGEVVLALPIVISFTHNSIMQIEVSAYDTAVTLGADRKGLAILLISEARFALLAALAASFGRVIGEVGVSMMLGGNIASYTRNITGTIALESSKGEFSLGIKLGLTLLVIALLVNSLLRYLTEKK